MVRTFLYLFELSFATLKRDASLKFETSNNSAQVILCEKDLRERKRGFEFLESAESDKDNSVKFRPTLLSLSPPGPVRNLIFKIKAAFDRMQLLF